MLQPLFQVLMGLEFLHSEGLVHNDLTPHNILVLTKGNNEAQATG